MDSILMTVKQFLGVDSNYDGFDQDIIIAVNNALMTLNQLGVGPAEGYRILGFDETWGDLLGASIDLESAKSLICLKSRLLFDPPATSFLISAIERQITEMEWRLRLQAEPPVV